MKKRMSFGVPVAVAGLALIAAGCGSAGTSSSRSGTGYAPPAAAVTTASASRAAAHADTVATRHTSLGDVLVDAHGRTLYLFEKDQGMTSACSAGTAGWGTAVGLDIRRSVVKAEEIARVLLTRFNYAL